MASEISKSAILRLSLAGELRWFGVRLASFGIGANRTNLLAAFVTGDHTWFTKHNAPITYEDSVCGTQVYADVV